MQKNSKQRESIIKNLQSRCDHPTAEMLYSDLKKEQPKLSLGTVYRNLNLLADSGQIMRIVGVKGPDHFDGFTKPHSHFVCNCCGKVIDMDNFLSDEFVKNAEGFSGRIDGFELKFVGLCEECLLQKKNN